MKWFIGAIVLLVITIGLSPDPPKQKEGGTIADAYQLFLEAIKTNPAYGREPCPRLSGTPCPRSKPEPAQYCPPPGGTP